MKTYHFDTKDGIPVRDRVELEFANDTAAIMHSKQVASTFRHDDPTGNVDHCVAAIDASGREIHREPIYPAET